MAVQRMSKGFRAWSSRCPAFSSALGGGNGCNGGFFWTALSRHPEKGLARLAAVAVEASKAGQNRKAGVALLPSCPRKKLIFHQKWIILIL